MLYDLSPLGVGLPGMPARTLMPDSACADAVGNINTSIINDDNNNNTISNNDNNTTNKLITLILITLLLLLIIIIITTSSKQSDPTSPNGSSLVLVRRPADVEWNPLYVDASFLIKDLSLGLGPPCLLLT